MKNTWVFLLFAMTGSICNAIDEHQLSDASWEAFLKNHESNEEFDNLYAFTHQESARALLDEIVAAYSFLHTVTPVAAERAYRIMTMRANSFEFFNLYRQWNFRSLSGQQIIGLSQQLSLPKNRIFAVPHKKLLSTLTPQSVQRRDVITLIKGIRSVLRCNGDRAVLFIAVSDPTSPAQWHWIGVFFTDTRSFSAPKVQIQYSIRQANTNLLSEAQKRGLEILINAVSEQTPAP